MGNWGGKGRFWGGKRDLDHTKDLGWEKDLGWKDILGLEKHRFEIKKGRFWMS